MIILVQDDLLQFTNNGNKESELHNFTTKCLITPFILSIFIREFLILILLKFLKVAKCGI